MFTLLFTNCPDASSHGRKFPTLGEAVAHGRSCGFEFSVWENGNRVASWEVFGGFRTW